MSSDTKIFHQSRVPGIYGGTITLMVLATIAVAARLVARRLSVAKYWWDDLLIVFALILSWGISACSWIAAFAGGSGRHSVARGGPVGPKELVIFLKTAISIQVLYIFSATSIKTSLILLYWRIFRVIRWFRWLLAAAWTIVILYFFVNVFVSIFKCRPAEFYWDKSIKGGTCINETLYFRWTGVANLLIDFMIWSLTLPVIWCLKLSARQKLSLSTVFLLGIFACVASIARVTAFDKVDPEDVTYTVAPAGMWTVVEQSMGILCVCLPTTKPLFDHLINRAKHSNSSGTDDTALPTPLKDYSSRSNSRPLAGVSKAGFTRLDEELALEPRSVSTHASTMPSGELSFVTDGIMKNQTLEQHSDHGLRS